ncbi:hypothetical protein [Bacillus cereus group sp. BfR-BA-01347]|uniref:hypothetical protein n=1 Tax=Bacillus cereus group sp. BfR-BA-01347 TaxID=2920310 RepID=UPI001F55DEFA|nr:hypothetical protein [Bacillus cereus group sp. BfR-BA-01347]
MDNTTSSSSSSSSSSSNSSSSSDYKFSTTDPLGKEIRLKSSTWENHITGGDHPERIELLDQEVVVKDVIEDPKYIYHDHTTPEGHERYRYVDLVELSTTNKLKYLRVIVEYDKDNTNVGHVVTTIAQSRVSQSTEGGAYYVRPKRST